ncbi:phage/plasmid primase, P4 family [Erythrobacter sp. sf7]|uniref:Phage/plasmid primase, P4 family n=1 Tax=Erythrobacter fulvus TaxID=2987523 RepID=A0ABT5JMJ6_9SPHN|nr:phage/plasmid primase, P4 family [Erythrobacter fulvus]MDC8753828.1 phage/plasmid primase, P4 family [Erythrobacter fulvus]
MHENAKVGPNDGLYEHGIIEAISRWGGKYEMTVAEAAVIYAQCGVSVFPCDPKTKKPLVEGGFKAATVDVNQVRTWWSKWPNAMIGVPTGSASGFWVLDVDDCKLFKSGRKVILPETLTATTGKGEHLYFISDDSRPVRNAQKCMKDGKACWPFPHAPGCDARGEGGYIIVPPSRHPNGNPYRWKTVVPIASATEDLYEAVTRAKRSGEVSRSARRATTAGIEEDARDPEQILEEACEQVRNAPEGAQEATLNSACFTMGALIAKGKVSYSDAVNRILEATATMPSFDPDNPWRPENLGNKVTRAIKDGMQKANKKQKRADKPSEDRCASVFVEELGARYLYDSDEQRWMKWSGQHWAPDRKNHVTHDIRLLVREASGGDASCCRSSFINGVRGLAAADPNIATEKAELDRDGFLLGTPDGTVELRSGELRRANPDDRITMIASAGPAEGQPQGWLTFIKQITEGDQDLARYLQKLVGYCLTGSTKEQSLFFLYGVGQNGKTVFLNVVQDILGDYAKTAATQTFMASKFARHTTDLAALAGARLVTASETEEHNAWDESLIKQVTGGEQITARLMRRDNFSFTPSFKLVVAGNYPPILNNVDPATRRRFIIIPFKFRPTHVDKDLFQKLLTERGQILSWAIEGCLMWQREGLSVPAIVREATEEFFSTQDPFQDWLDQKCKSAGNGTTTSSGDLWASWSEFAKMVGEDPRSKKAMALKLQAKGYQMGRTGRRRFYRGIALQYGDGEQVK